MPILQKMERMTEATDGNWTFQKKYVVWSEQTIQHHWFESNAGAERLLPAKHGLCFFGMVYRSCRCSNRTNVYDEFEYYVIQPRLFSNSIQEWENNRGYTYQKVKDLNWSSKAFESNVGWHCETGLCLLKFRLVDDVFDDLDQPGCPEFLDA